MEKQTVWLSALMATLVACSCAGDDPHGQCPGGLSEWAATRADGTYEVWCQSRDGRAQGPYRSERTDGSALASGGFESGLAHGEWLLYDAQGELEERRFYAYGIRCGEWESYAGGTLVDSVEYAACDTIDPPVAPPGGAPSGPPSVSVWDGVDCDEGTPRTETEPRGSVIAWCDSGGVRVGPFVRWRTTTRDIPWVVGQYEDGRRTGTWSEFHEDGSIAAQGAYADDATTGIWRYWDRLGAAAAVGELRAGVREGVWAEYWPTGFRAAAGEYSGGLRTGTWQGFDPAGALISEVGYEGGVPVGEARYYHPGGFQLEETGAFEAGSRVGAWSAFYPNGARHWEGSYDQGRPHGVWTWYDTEDRLVTDSTYDQGVPVGTWTSHVYTAEGDQYVTIPYVQGLRHGLARGFWVDGDRPLFEETLVQGNLTGPSVTWYRSGQVYSEGDWLVDERIGVWTWYYEDGQVLSSGEWLRNRPVGPWVYYWPNGQVRAQGEYLMEGEKTGEWQYFHEDGTPATEEEVS